MEAIGPASTPILSGLEAPIVQAPMAGGPPTPELAAAVNRGGGLGFLAAGYLTAERLAGEIARLRAITDRPFGVNVFAAAGTAADPELVARFAEQIASEAALTEVTLGTPRFDDDALADKLALLTDDPPAVVSFTFAAPPAAAIAALRRRGAEVWVTVTSPAEALQAAALEPDALIVQGVEAGGHRAVFVDDDAQSELTLLAALQLIEAVSELPLVAAGALATGAALAAVLAFGAAAGQVGTAYLRADEAGTSRPQRAATATDAPTVLTRAFSGRTARGITNRWHELYGAGAPRAYPEVHHLTSPLRAHGRAAGDPDLINLWAGQAHVLAGEGSGEQITRRLAADAAQALARARERLS